MDRRWEDAFQGRSSIRWDSIRTMDSKKWISGFLTILMERDRACWSNRRQQLLGSRNDRYRLQRHRLHLQVNIWHMCDAPREEVLNDISKLKERPIILSKNNGALAKWLDCRYKDRANTMTAIAQRTGQLSISHFMRPIEIRRQHKGNFQTRLQDAVCVPLFVQAQIRLMGIDCLKNLST